MFNGFHEGQSHQVMVIVKNALKKEKKEKKEKKIKSHHFCFKTGVSLHRPDITTLVDWA